MKRAYFGTGLCLLLACVFCLTIPVSTSALEEGDVEGAIERINDKFLRDYNTLDYKGKKKWKTWGEGLNALGWIVVQGDSGELKDHLLLVIDTRTLIKKEDGTNGQFSDFTVGGRIQASYRMGWDALHVKEIKILK